MKILLFISILLVSSILNAQFVQGEMVRRENSKKIAEFAFESEGKKIGSGICRDLVIEAVKKIRPKDVNFILQNIKKFRIEDTSKIVPGDIVIFYNVVSEFEGELDTIDNHIGIVTEWYGDLFCYAEQNTNKKGNKKIKAIDRWGQICEVYEGSRVEIVCYMYKFMKNGRISFYRF